MRGEIYSAKKPQDFRDGTGSNTSQNPSSAKRSAPGTQVINKKVKISIHGLNMGGGGECNVS